MKKKIAIAVTIVLVVTGALVAIKAMQIRKLIAGAQAYAPPPESISSAEVREANWQDTLDVIGSITAVQGVNVTTEVAGTISEIAFESGAVVAKGDLLVRLDTSSEEAQLRAVESQLELNRLNAERMRTLRAANTVSASDLDTAEATLKQSQASADEIRATIAKKTIRAPFHGKLGIRMVNLGQYLDTGKPIVSLQSLSPVYADFSLPQQNLAQLKTSLGVQVTTDAYPDTVFKGILTAINPDLDESTRSVRLQATLDNPGQKLRPGMFARIQVLLPTEQKVLAVPAPSILSAPYGQSVFVVESQGGTNGSAAGLVVRQRFIRTGAARGDFVSVTTGLKAGEKVASAGLFKLRNGVAVVENNQIVPAAAEAPLPPER
jgi:membrane fusion protein (multidrug efflux system)